MLRNDLYVRLCRARDMLAEVSDARVLLADVAQEAAISPCHFIRTFKSAFGLTPHEYRTRVRLERAKHLLISSDFTVTDVCMEVGFTSLGSFSDLFARNVGLPPSQFRRRMRSMVQVPGMYPRDLIPHCFAAMYCRPA